MIEAELKESGAVRAAPLNGNGSSATPASNAQRREARARRQKSLDPKEDFLRMLRLSGLDSDAMSDETRDTFVNMAENLGIEFDEAEDLIDLYLDEADKMADQPFAANGAAAWNCCFLHTPSVKAVSSPRRPNAEPVVVVPEMDNTPLPNFVNSLECQMIFIPVGRIYHGKR